MKWTLQHIYNSWFKPGNGKRVFVGVSGGVDSSVTALLLKLYGYDVTGVFIRTWQPEWIECTWRDERRDAMRVCAHLEIPFIELDLEKEYKEGVADYMIAEYRAGRTPNPDVMCNREVKFGGFLTWALDNGADYVATGHYAQHIQGVMHKGIDQTKDQSYFLWTLTNDQLSKVLFPIGEIQKKQVRKFAERYHIPVAMKKDSQGICFIGDIDMKEFLSHYIESAPGNVCNEQGEIIGTHDGVLFYTLGERHGFTIDKKTTNDKPYYVIAKDIKKNILIVSEHPNQSDTPSEINLVDCVWRIEPTNKVYTAQIRYHGDFKNCIIKNDMDTYVISFKQSDEIVSPGQSVVVYDDTVCIGGGIVM
jgi:tRNA-specific 2-thiouridylase